MRGIDKATRKSLRKDLREGKITRKQKKNIKKAIRTSGSYTEEPIGTTIVDPVKSGSTGSGVVTPNRPKITFPNVLGPKYKHGGKIKSWSNRANQYD